MMDIAAFLTARLDERQAAAEAAQAVDPSPWHASVSGGGFPTFRSGHGSGLVVAADNVALWDCEGSSTLCMTLPTAEHIARHDPARVLADVKAKRAILAEHAIVHRDIGWLEDGEEAGDEIPVCGRCVPRHSHYLSRAEVPEGPCRTVRLLAAPDADHSDYNPAWAVRRGQ